MASDAQHNKQRSAKKVAVVGAGASGLAAAYKLKLQGLKVTVFEADGRTGGKIRSVFQDGLIWDEGANTMTESEIEVRKLLDSLELREQQQIETQPQTNQPRDQAMTPILQNNRYIVKNGVPELLPSNPIALMKSNILSTRSKLQIILEPFLWKRRNISKTSTDEEESVGQFFQRHFGKEVVDYLINPFIAGSSAGDPEHISMRHAFPEIWQIEKRFGSIIFGAIQSKLSAKREKGETTGSSGRQKHQRHSFSFYGGMQTLTNALYDKLGKDDLKLKSEVLSLSYCFNGESASKNWSVSSAHGKHSQDMPFDAVIMTAPLCNVKQMKISKGGKLFPLTFIPEVEYLPLSVIITTFKKENVKRPLEGFGVLVPCKEQQNGLKSLGTLFSSMMFPDRAPSDLYMYTTFIGGSRNRELAKASMNELRQIVSSDLRLLLGAEGEPTFVNHFYWSKAFPLYGCNYGSVVDSIKRLEENLPGFFYAGNHKGGLSVGKSIASGCKAADLVISYLDSSSDDKVC